MKLTKRKTRSWPLVVLSLAAIAAPFVVIERPWEARSQARWLLMAGQPQLALDRLLPSEAPELRALALHALGRTDELKSLLTTSCVAVASALDRTDRERLGVSLSTCN